MKERIVSIVDQDGRRASAHFAPFPVDLRFAEACSMADAALPDAQNNMGCYGIDAVHLAVKVKELPVLFLLTATSPTDQPVGKWQKRAWVEEAEAVAGHVRADRGIGAIDQSPTGKKPRIIDSLERDVAQVRR